jgi:hypothetical protein
MPRRAGGNARLAPRRLRRPRRLPAPHQVGNGERRPERVEHALIDGDGGRLTGLRRGERCRQRQEREGESEEGSRERRKGMGHAASVNQNCIGRAIRRVTP